MGVAGCRQLTDEPSQLIIYFALFSVPKYNSITVELVLKESIEFKEDSSDHGGLS